MFCGLCLSRPSKTIIGWRNNAGTDRKIFEVFVAPSPSSAIPLPTSRLIFVVPKSLSGYCYFVIALFGGFISISTTRLKLRGLFLHRLHVIYINLLWEYIFMSTLKACMVNGCGSLPRIIITLKGTNQNFPTPLLMV